MAAHSPPSAGLLPQVAGILGHYITAMQDLAREDPLKRGPDSKGGNWWAQKARVVRANYAWLLKKRSAWYADSMRCSLGLAAEQWGLELIRDVRAVRQCVNIWRNRVRSVDAHRLKPLLQRLRETYGTLAEAIQQLYAAEDDRRRAKKRAGRRPTRKIAERDTKIIKALKDGASHDDIVKRFGISVENSRRIKCDAKKRRKL